MLFRPSSVLATFEKFLGGMRMLYIVSYDISLTKRRNRIAKALENYGRRVQYSVFECELDEKRFRKLYSEMMKETDGMEDGSVRFYPICESCAKKAQIIGFETPSKRREISPVIVV